MLLSLIAIAVVMAGCEEPAAPVDTSVPVGVYRYESVMDKSGMAMRRSMMLRLLSQREGALYDTVFRQENGEWLADSVSRMELRFQNVGDSYHRAIAIARRGDAFPDTSLAYWRFTRYGDSISYSVSQRFNGPNLSLVGTWQSYPGDTALSKSNLRLEFRSDSVVMNGYAPGVPAVAGTFAYTISNDSLGIKGAPIVLGDRYSVTPSVWLYLSTRPYHGFALSR